MKITEKEESIHNDKKNAVCYYFTPEAQGDLSIEQQKELACSYAENKNLHIIKEYVNCDGFEEMISEVEYLKPAYLLLYKKDKLTRNKYVFQFAELILRDSGCKIVFTG